MKYGTLPLYIDGQLRPAASNATHPILCPATEEPIAEIAWADAADAQAALQAAQQGFAAWSKISIAKRIQYMSILRELVLRDRDKLQEAVIDENGKTWTQADEDVTALINSLKFYAEEITRIRGEILPDSDGQFEHKLVHQPLGVAVAYLAWNFPLLNLAFKLGPALASGCSIIIKPSAETPVSAYLVAALCHEAGLPAGVVNILAGPNDPVATTLCSSPIPRLLTLIGSTATGLRIIEQGNTTIKRHSMELGGNAPAIVFADADLDKAADLVAALKFANSGQICVTPNRVLVEQSVFQPFVDKIIARARKVRLGHGSNPNVDMGPVISEAALLRVARWIEEAAQAGANIECGGQRPPSFPKGYYYEPTVLTNVTPDMTVCRSEIFGPVVSIIPFSDDDQALALANDTDAGLSSFLFTNSHHRIHRLTTELEFGEVMVNGLKYHIDLPHGGIKQSGLGHDCSHLALHDYLTTKRITTAFS